MEKTYGEYLVETAVDGLTDNPVKCEAARRQLARIVDEADQAKRDRADLLAALRPFANLDIAHMADKGDAHPVFGLNNTTMLLSDIRKAKDLLRRLDREALTGTRDG